MENEKKNEYEVEVEFDSEQTINDLLLEMLINLM